MVPPWAGNLGQKTIPLDKRHPPIGSGATSDNNWAEESQGGRKKKKKVSRKDSEKNDEGRTISNRGGVRPR